MGVQARIHLPVVPEAGISPLPRGGKSDGCRNHGMGPAEVSGGGRLPPYHMV